MALELSLAVLLIESFGAYFSRSLSVTVDAVHNVPDLLAFAASYTALRVAAGGATESYTFGPHRLEVFAGLFNAALVLGTGAVFAGLAVVALVHGTSLEGPIDGPWILAAAAPTLLLRSVSLYTLEEIPSRARDLNLRGVVIHLASDLLITGALVATGLLLWLHPNWVQVDSGAALLIGAILVYESGPLFGEAWEVLTEKTPRGISLEAVQKAVESVPHVSELHDLHVWAVCPTLVCMTAHIQVDEMSVREGMAVVAELRSRMESQFGILHSTFEVEVIPRTSAARTRPAATPL